MASTTTAASDGCRDGMITATAEDALLQRVTAAATNAATAAAVAAASDGYADGISDGCSE